MESGITYHNLYGNFFRLYCILLCSSWCEEKNFSQSYPFIVISDRKIFLMLLFQLLTFYMTAKIKMEQTGNSVLAEAVNETMMEAKFGESRYSLGFGEFQEL